MRHQKAGAKLGRTSSHREAMFRNMVTSLFKHQRIRTTAAKAKAVRGWADHVITLAKRGDLHARRQVLAIIREKAVAHKLFEEAAERFGGLSGGYTRVVKIGRRPGDAAQISLVELVTAAGAASKKTAPKPTVTATPTPTPASTETAPAVEAETPTEEAAAAEETAPAHESTAGQETAAEAEKTSAEAAPETEAAQSEDEETPAAEKSEKEGSEETDTRKTE